MATSTGTNRKKLLLPTTMSKAGWAIVEARDDVEGVSFVPTVPKAELPPYGLLHPGGSRNSER